ncbi:MAG: SGNH/GDSL hydrolase family protein [Reyranellaceae bacterium]
MADPQEKPPAQPRLAVRIVGTLVSFVVAVVLTAALAEIFSRVVVDDGMHFDLEMWKYAKEIKRESDVPGLGHEHRPSTAGHFMGVPVSINALGLRDRDYTPAKPAGAVRIVMLGDSVTFGWGVRIEDTPSKMVERLLNAGTAAPRYEVINTGVGNYNTVQEVTYFLNRGLQLDPDIVVLNYFINDAEPTPLRKQSALAERSYAAVAGLSAFDTLSRAYFGKADWREYYSNLYRPDAAAWQAAQQSIRDLARRCRERGIKLLIANYPELHVLQDYPFAAVTQAVRALAAAENVPFVDLLPSVAALPPESLWVSPTDAHPNRIANERFAALLAAELRKSFPDLVAAGN